MKQAFIYSLKVWLTIIIVAPIIGAAILYYRFTEQMFRTWPQVFKVPQMAIELGVIVYLPAWLVFAFVSAYLNGRLTDRYKKILLSITAVVLSTTAFIGTNYHSLFYDDTSFLADIPPNLMWTCTYAGVAFLTAWFYKLRPKTTDNNQVETSP